MHFLRLYVLISFLRVLPAPAQETLTESAFLAPFDENHLAVQALTEDLARAGGARRRAGTLGNPRVDFDREAPGDNPLQTTWTAAWAPPLDGRRSLARQVADAGLEAARAQFSADRIRLRREIRKAYADWALSVERRDVLKSQKEMVANLAEQTRRRAEAGEESGIAARRLALASAEIGAELAIAKADAIRAEALARAWRPDLPPNARVSRPPLDAAPPATGTIRPEVEALRFEVRQAELEGRLSRRFFVFPELYAGWQTLRQQGVTHGGPVYGVSWSIPLFDRFQASRLEADQRKKALEARLTLTSARIQAEIEAARSAYKQLAATASEQAEALADTQKIVEGVAASFRSGESTVTDVVETLRSVREARSREIDLYAQALETQRALEAASATPLNSEGPR